ncbi:voltage-dependent anion channel-domain-containing protein [Phyllosticta citriasiana]|uniref:voltage-dependent anion channel-domain-containing protein n=1 Tax=Phyllosticta citriasiana TaxID=595635 RepID=UPI0030FD8FF0
MAEPLHPYPSLSANMTFRSNPSVSRSSLHHDNSPAISKSPGSHHSSHAATPIILQNGFQVGQDANEKAHFDQKLGFRERIRHFTWTWFCMTMATGGIANVLYSVPLRFHGLFAIGCIFFILNIVLFIFNIVMISTRFYLYPHTFRASFLHPTENLFIPASLISFGTILVNISQYGVPAAGQWLEDAMVVLFWIYCALAILFSVGIYLIMWSTTTFTISQMTPIWIFPAYPLLITGPHAGNLAQKTGGLRALDIIIGGTILQGIGFMVSTMIYAAFMYRLMTQKLPRESLRPGMFISVGPSGFTVSGIVNMGNMLPKCIPANFMGDGRLTGQISRVLANWIGIWLWGLAMWFFFVSVGAHWAPATRRRMDFAMTWYSFVFPNTALTTATFAVAKALDNNHALQIIGCVLTCGLIVTWFFVFSMMIRAVVTRQILWPQKQEDRNEGGFKTLAAHSEMRDQRKLTRTNTFETPAHPPDTPDPEMHPPAPTPFMRTPFHSDTDLTKSQGHNDFLKPSTCA